jgi:hypothetical protein
MEGKEMSKNFTLKYEICTIQGVRVVAEVDLLDITDNKEFNLRSVSYIIKDAIKKYFNLGELKNDNME